MNEITTLIDFIQNIGFVGLLIILAIPSLRKKIFNGEGKIITDIRDNHLHEIKEILKETKDDQKSCHIRIEEKLEDIKEHLIYLKAKQNGK